MGCVYSDLFTMGTSCTYTLSLNIFRSAATQDESWALIVTAHAFRSPSRGVRERKLLCQGVNSAISSRQFRVPDGSEMLRNRGPRVRFRSMYTSAITCVLLAKLLRAPRAYSSLHCDLSRKYVLAPLQYERNKPREA